MGCPYGSIYRTTGPLQTVAKDKGWIIIWRLPVLNYTIEYKTGNISFRGI